MTMVIGRLYDSNLVEAIHTIIRGIGDDPDRQGLKETPGRVIDSWRELFSGYNHKVEDVFKTFDEPCNEMVIIKKVEVYSTCEHHMLPFFGVAHIAYLPDGKVIGASKLPRILEVYARRLQVQERLTQQVTKAITDHLKPKGAACLIEARHLCMCARGINKQQSVMVTSSLTGAFHDDQKTRAEFFQLIKE